MGGSTGLDIGENCTVFISFCFGHIIDSFLFGNCVFRVANRSCRDILASEGVDLLTVGFMAESWL